MTNLRELNDWCKSTKALHLVVRFYGDNPVKQQWCLRVCPNHSGMAHPICTRHGEDIEALAVEAMEKAKKVFAEQEASIRRKNVEADKCNAQKLRNDFYEIEAMHRTAADY